MKNRTRITYAVVLMAGVGGLAWWLGQPREPVYEGKPLTFWLRTCNAHTEASDYDRDQKQLDQVIAAVGTNALPTLLRLLQAKDSAVDLKRIAMLKWLDHNYAVKFDYSAAEQRILEGSSGLGRLHGEAMVVLPDLIKIYEKNISPDSREGVVYTLAGLGPEAEPAVPTLLKWLSVEPENRDLFFALGAIHSDPELVVPILIDHLHDAKAWSRWSAAQALGAFGPAAKSAVPALTELRNDENAWVCKGALFSLNQISPAIVPKPVTESRRAPVVRAPLKVK